MANGRIQLAEDMGSDWIHTMKGQRGLLEAHKARIG
jgi:hypothetical protein